MGLPDISVVPVQNGLPAYALSTNVQALQMQDQTMAPNMDMITLLFEMTLCDNTGKSILDEIDIPCTSLADGTGDVILNAKMSVDRVLLSSSDLYVQATLTCHLQVIPCTATKVATQKIKICYNDEEVRTVSSFIVQPLLTVTSVLYAVNTVGIIGFTLPSLPPTIPLQVGDIIDLELPWGMQIIMPVFPSADTFTILRVPVQPNRYKYQITMKTVNSTMQNIAQYVFLYASVETNACSITYTSVSNVTLALPSVCQGNPVPLFVMDFSKFSKHQDTQLVTFKTKYLPGGYPITLNLAIPFEATTLQCIGTPEGSVTPTVIATLTRVNTTQYTVVMNVLSLLETTDCTFSGYFINTSTSSGLSYMNQMGLRVSVTLPNIVYSNYITSSVYFGGSMTKGQMTVKINIAGARATPEQYQQVSGDIQHVETPYSLEHVLAEGICFRDQNIVLNTTTQVNSTSIRIYIHENVSVQTSIVCELTGLYTSSFHAAGGVKVWSLITETSTITQDPVTFPTLSSPMFALYSKHYLYRTTKQLFVELNNVMVSENDTLQFTHPYTPDALVNSFKPRAPLSTDQFSACIDEFLAVYAYVKLTDTHFVLTFTSLAERMTKVHCFIPFQLTKGDVNSLELHTAEYIYNVDHTRIWLPSVSYSAVTQKTNHPYISAKFENLTQTHVPGSLVIRVSQFRIDEAKPGGCNDQTVSLPGQCSSLLLPLPQLYTALSRYCYNTQYSEAQEIVGIVRGHPFPNVIPSASLVLYFTNNVPVTEIECRIQVASPFETPPRIASKHMSLSLPNQSMELPHYVVQPNTIFPLIKVNVDISKTAECLWQYQITMHINPTKSNVRMYIPLQYASHKTFLGCSHSRDINSQFSMHQANLLLLYLVAATDMVVVSCYFDPAVYPVSSFTLPITVQAQNNDYLHVTHTTHPANTVSMSSAQVLMQYSNRTNALLPVVFAIEQELSVLLPLATEIKAFKFQDNRLYISILPLALSIDLDALHTAQEDKYSLSSPSSVETTDIPTACKTECNKGCLPCNIGRACTYHEDCTIQSCQSGKCGYYPLSNSASSVGSTYNNILLVLLIITILYTLL